MDLQKTFLNLMAHKFWVELLNWMPSKIMNFHFYQNYNNTHLLQNDHSVYWNFKYQNCINYQVVTYAQKKNSL